MITSRTMIGAAFPEEGWKRAQQPDPQVDLACLAEVGVPLTGAGVERHQLRSQSRHDAPRLAVSPVAEATRLANPFAVARAGVPVHLAGRRLERRDGAHPGAEVEESACHEGRRLGADWAASRIAVADGVRDDRLAPDDFEIGDVVPIDLVERQVLGAGLVGGVRRPFHRLSGREAGLPDRNQTEHCHADQEATGNRLSHRVFPFSARTPSPNMAIISTAVATGGGTQFGS